MSEAYSEDIEYTEQPFPLHEGIIREVAATALHALETPEHESATPVLTSSDSLRLYLRELSKTPLLSAQQEVELSKRIEAGLYAQNLLNRQDSVTTEQESQELVWLSEDGQEAKNHLIQANLRLVVFTARKYANSRVPLMDRIQDGNTGLIRAVEKYDYTKGYRFSTYASWWIKDAIISGLREQGSIVRLPSGVSNEVSQLNKAERELLALLGREPTVSELASELEVTPNRITDLKTWRKEHISLDTPLSEDGQTTLGDIYSEGEAEDSPHNIAQSNEQTDILNALIDQLPERTARILRKRYALDGGQPATYEEIGAIEGIYGTRVRTIEQRAIYQLRRIAGTALSIE